MTQSWSTPYHFRVVKFVHTAPTYIMLVPVFVTMKFLSLCSQLIRSCLVVIADSGMKNFPKYLGNPGSAFRHKKQVDLLQDEDLVQIAEKHNVSPGQILVRYQIDKGRY